MRLIFFVLSSFSFAYFINGEEFAFVSLSNSNPQEYTAVVLRNGVPVCAGALIAKSSLYNTIVTAAHCVYPVSTNKISVRLGNSQPVEAQRIFVYPHYAPPSVDFDVAVIKYISSTTTSTTSTTTSTTSTTTTTSPQTSENIQLSETEPKKGALVKICVRGKNNNQWSFESGDATVESKKVCKSMYEGIVSVSNRMICAYSNAFSVDGSPLVYNNTLAGITSKSGNGKLPTIYTSLANSDIRYFIDNYL